MSDIYREASKKHLTMMLESEPDIKRATILFNEDNSVSINIKTRRYIDASSVRFAEILTKILNNMTVGVDVKLRVEPTWYGKLVFYISKLFRRRK